MKGLKRVILFIFGGFCYVTLELLWRGRSHSSMFFAGGLCFLLIGKLEEIRPRLSLPLRALVGSGIITMVELAVGLAVNRRFNVWDYREMPGNFCGQICPLFSLLWMFVALGAGQLYRRASEKVSAILSRRAA